MRENVKKALSKLDKDEQKKLLAYRKPPSRLGISKTATFSPTDEWDYGLDPEMTLEAGLCPCSKCGHVAMFQCEEAGCKCCSSACC